MDNLYNSFVEVHKNITVSRNDYINGIIIELGSEQKVHADTYALKYQQCNVNRWIRTEAIIPDFEAAFSPYLNLHDIDLQTELTEKSNSTQYNPNLQKWFTPTDLQNLYNACPIWRDLELQLYGNNLTIQ